MSDRQGLPVQSAAEAGGLVAGGRRAADIEKK